MRSQRKDHHLELALAQPKPTHPLDAMRIKPCSLPDINVADVDLRAHYLGHDFDYPFYINAMTGGSEKAKQYNGKLAQLAAQHHLAMAVGSQHAALDDPNQLASYTIVRELNPKGFIMGNVNPNATLKQAQTAVAMLQANALQIHVNVAQELTMTEGDREFSHWLTNIQTIVEGVNVPVLVKEVGNGLDAKSVKRLIDIGVKHVDVSGRGGTNFIWIEDQRRETPRYDYLKDWGLTTLEAMLENKQHLDKLEILASGGVTSPLDVMKLLVLGAKAVGLSGYFLKLVHEGKSLDPFIEDLKHLFVLVNRQNIQGLVDVDYEINR